jgi:hypothetical protein
MRVMAFNQMMKQYNKDLILVSGSKDKLTEPWERKLDQYLTAWMEQLYSARQMEEEKKKATAKAAEARAGLVALDEQLLKQLREAGATNSGAAVETTGSFIGKWQFEGDADYKLIFAEGPGGFTAVQVHQTQPNSIGGTFSDVRYFPAERKLTFEWFLAGYDQQTFTYTLSADGNRMTGGYIDARGRRRIGLKLVRDDEFTPLLGIWRIDLGQGLMETLEFSRVSGGLEGRHHNPTQGCSGKITDVKYEPQWRKLSYAWSNPRIDSAEGIPGGKNYYTLTLSADGKSLSGYFPDRGNRRDSQVRFTQQ